MSSRSVRSGKKTNEKGSVFGFRSSKIGNDEMVNCIVENENEKMQFMVEDLCQWLSQIVGQDMEVTPNNFFSQLEDGVILCRLANSIQEYAIKAAASDETKPYGQKIKFKSSNMCQRDRSKFHARENVCKFLEWCRSHKIPSPMLFESNDIVIGGTDGGREVIICLMNLAKRFSIDYYVPAPETVKVEVEQEIKNKKEKSGSAEYNVSYQTLQHEKEIQEQVQVTNPLDNSTNSYSDMNLESRGSYHFGNISGKKSDSELSTKDIETLKKLIDDDPFDEDLQSNKENSNKPPTRSQSLVENKSREIPIDIFSNNQDKNAFKDLDVERSKQFDNLFRASVGPVKSFSDTRAEPLHENLFGTSIVSNDILDAIADTVMLNDDQNGETLKEKQMLLEEDDLFSINNATSQYNINPVETENFGSISQDNTGNQNPLLISEQTNCENHPSTNENVSQSLLGTRCNPVIDMINDADKQGRTPITVSSNRCECVCDSNICGDSEMVTHQDKQIEDPSYFSEHEFLCCDRNQSRGPTSIDDDLGDLKNFCHILRDSGQKREEPMLKFVCVQLGEKYIFMKRVNNCMFVRYNRQWIVLDRLIGDLTGRKSSTSSLRPTSSQQ